ncbi:MAG: hypothetical protein RLZZ628_678, partial [Bacteroidota bacterium]
NLRQVVRLILSNDLKGFKIWIIQ